MNIIEEIQKLHNPALQVLSTVNRSEAELGAANCEMSFFDLIFISRFTLHSSRFYKSL